MPQYCARFLLASLTVSLLTACGQGPDSLEALLTRAEANWQKGEVNAALLDLKTASQSFPDDPLARQRLAEMNLRLADPAAAQKEIDKAAERGLDKLDVELLNIRAALLRGEYDVALTRFETEPKLLGNPALAALHGDILLRLDRADEAFERYTAALANGPDAVALQGLARIHAMRGEVKSARSHVDQALALDPRNADLHMLDADLKNAAGDAAGARLALEQAMHWSPYALGPPLTLVRLELNAREYAAARDRLDGLQKRFKNNVLINYYKGLVAYFAEDFATAEQEFREVLRLAPAHVQSHLYMGFLMYRKQNLEQAETHLLLYWQSDPDYLPAKKLLAAIQIQRKKPSEALATLEHLGEDADAELLGLRANAYFSTGNTEAGLNTLQLAAQQAPDNANIKTALILAKTKLGLVDEAIALLEPEVPVDGQVTRRETMLLYAYMTRQEWDKVIETAERMRAVAGDDPALLNAMGTAYIGKKDPAKAKQLLYRALESSPDTPTVLRNLALLELNAGDLDAAQPHIDKLLALDENDGATLTLAGLAAASRGDLDGAATLWERARVAAPTAIEARLRLASHYVHVQDYQKAVDVATEALALEPRSQAASLNLGHGLRGLGKLDLAEQVARGLLESSPDLPKAEFLLGLILLESGQATEAEAHLRRADKLQPDLPDVLVPLVKATLARADGVPAAQEILERIVAIEGESARVVALRGDLASVGGDNAAAAEFYRQALALDDRDGWAINTALALTKAGQGAEAIALLESRSAARPDNPQLHFFLAQVHERLGDAEAAIAAYSKVLQTKPDDIVTLNNLALLELDQGGERAVQYAEAAYALAPTDPAIADTYGWVLFNRGKAEAGVKALQAAAQAAPANGDINFHYAVALAKQGNKREAVAILRRALEGGEFASRAAAAQLLAQLSS